MSDAGSPLEGRRILVVEDEYVIAMEAKRRLQQAGAQVIGPVPSVEQALDLIADDGLDAAVLDVNLGDGATVYAAADALAEHEVPYLFATGDVRVSDANADRDRPSLAKPYTADELVRALAKLLTAPRRSS